ncbi:asparagine synthase-domain-containing protein [Gongronella butleri]|nr:asparagine synthase-domain-containing protein [Gongronella butleri]
MCGILFRLLRSDAPETHDDLWTTLKQLNTKRGPDAQSERAIQVDDWSLVFFSSVLHLRGPTTVAQPLQNTETGDILCWNGEVFAGLDVPMGQNDTQVVMHALEIACNASNAPTAPLLRTIERIEGPFAFVYWHKRSCTLYFARDCLGRRSLLWHQDAENDKFMLSSIGTPSSSTIEWEEVPAKGVYALHLDQNATSPVLYPWTTDLGASELMPRLPFGRVNATVPGEETLLSIDDASTMPIISDAMAAAITSTRQLLSESVRRRVADVPYLISPHQPEQKQQQPRVAILFSGGIDCTALAALAHDHLPVNEPIDLLNVAFENPRTENARKQQQKQQKKHSSSNEPERSPYDTPDRLTGRATLQELREMAPERQWHFIEIDVPYKEAMEHKQDIIDRMYPLDTVMDLSIAMALWFAARGKGTLEGVEYTSHARVLLSGLGADEQLGGYSRHREAYKRGSWAELIKEVRPPLKKKETQVLTSFYRHNWTWIAFGRVIWAVTTGSSATTAKRHASRS